MNWRVAHYLTFVTAWCSQVVMVMLWAARRIEIHRAALPVLLFYLAASIARRIAVERETK